MTLRVCFPVCNTTATTEPDAITVLAQSALSMLKDSSIILFVPGSV